VGSYDKGEDILSVAFNYSRGMAVFFKNGKEISATPPADPSKGLGFIIVLLSV
jgi:hypothetical protein